MGKKQLLVFCIMVAYVLMFLAIYFVSINEINEFVRIVKEKGVSIKDYIDNNHHRNALSLIYVIMDYLFIPFLFIGSVMFYIYRGNTANSYFKGITIFADLLIIGSLYQIGYWVGIDTYRQLGHPLPNTIIIIRFYIAKILLALGLATGAGLLFQKNIFRKAAVFIGIYILCYYLIEGPLTIKNLIRLQYFKIDIKFITGAIIEFGFGLGLIYYFTRPKVKELFK